MGRERQGGVTLIELVSCLRTREEAGKFFGALFPGVEIDLIDSFIKQPVSLASDVVFLNLEEVGDCGMHLEIKGEKYENLFPVGEMQAVVERSALSRPGCAAEDLAVLFLQYRKAETPGWVEEK